MKAKTITMTVLCPYCGTGYTFRNPARRAEFTSESTTPLHPACQASAANVQRMSPAGPTQTATPHWDAETLRRAQESGREPWSIHC